MRHTSWRFTLATGKLSLRHLRLLGRGVGLMAAVALAPVSTAEGADLFDLSMDQLSQVEIKSDITSIRAKPIREQPGIVSVITAKEIKETGARDLSDVLLRVPGYGLDTDVQSLVGLTFRGLMAQEGKALLVLDGIEVNEPLYGSLPILNHIPADMIEQVEIIRGPGSSMYGGMAGLSVIRVTTKGANQNGGYGVLTPAYADGRFAQNVTAGLGYAREDWRFSFNGAFSETSLSNQRYTALDGTSVDLTHRSDMGPWLLDFGGGWRDLDVRVIYDAYRYDDVVDYGIPLSTPNHLGFDSLLTSVKYDVHASEWLKITPAFTYRHQQPWEIVGADGNYRISTDRYQVDLSGVAELTDTSSLLVGTRFQRDEAQAEDTSLDGVPPAIYYGGHRSVSYDDVAGYAQYDLDTRWVNVSLGGRYEHQDAVGGAFVPRMALTRAWDQFHLKALYNQAFRTPGINVVRDAVTQLEAERTANYELEGGYRFGGGVSVVGNIFYMEVEEPIIFISDPSLGGAGEGYFNGQDLSTYGFESELRWDRPQFSSYLSYSLYQAGDNDELYVRGDDTRFLGTPTHKVTLSGTWHVFKQLDWNVNGFWLSERLAYAFPSAGITGLDPEFVLNTFINYHVGQFAFGVGVANLLDVDRYAPQPYAGGSGPLPLKGREVFAKLSVKF